MCGRPCVKGLVHDVQNGAGEPGSAPVATRGFIQEAELCEAVNGLPGGGSGDAQCIGCTGNRGVGVDKQRVQERQRAVVFCQLRAKIVAQLQQRAALLNGTSRGLVNSRQEISNPVRPVTVGSDALQQVVVISFVVFDVAGQIEQRLAEAYLRSIRNKVISSRPIRPLPSRKG